MTSIPREAYILLIAFTVLSTIGFSLGSLMFWAAAAIYALAPSKWYRDKKVRYIVVPLLVVLAGCLTMLAYYSYEAAKYAFHLRLMAQ